MERSHLRKACLLLAIVLSVALTSCRLAPAERADVLPGQGPTPEAGGPGREHGESGGEVPRDGTAQAGTKPFVTWDPATTIPFLLICETNGSDAYYLGLWDLKAGNVSFKTDPLFTISATCLYDIWWDGGDRFGCVPMYPEKLSVTRVDPGIRLDLITENADKVILFACPSDGGTFVVYRDAPDKLVLDIRDHPLAGKAVLSTDLPPNTRLGRVIGLQAGDENVKVYCLTLREPSREASGNEAQEYVQALLEVTYRGKDAHAPQTWRMIHPYVGDFFEDWPSFTQYGQSFLVHYRNETRTVDLTTGETQPFTAGREALGMIGATSAWRDREVWNACSYVYSGYLVLQDSYMRAGRGHVDHFVALKNGKVAGRLEAGGGYLEAFKDNVETFEVTFPHDFYEVRFPTEMQKTELKDPPAVPNAFSPEAFYAIWMDARYPELFNETLRCDGWKSESMAFVLMTRFDQDPLGFLRALSRAYPKEVERVGDLLVYYADYQDLDAFRQRIESLRKETSDQGELRTLDVILQSIEEFKRGGL